MKIAAELYDNTYNQCSNNIFKIHVCYFSFHSQMSIDENKKKCNEVKDENSYLLNEGLN